jgi:hypothetical protein
VPDRRGGDPAGVRSSRCERSVRPPPDRPRLDCAQTRGNRSAAKRCGSDVVTVKWRSLVIGVHVRDESTCEERPTWQRPATRGGPARSGRPTTASARIPESAGRLRGRIRAHRIGSAFPASRSPGLAGAAPGGTGHSGGLKTAIVPGPVMRRSERGVGPGELGNRLDDPPALPTGGVISRRRSRVNIDRARTSAAPSHTARHGTAESPLGTLGGRIKPSGAVLRPGSDVALTCPRPGRKPSRGHRPEARCEGRLIFGIVLTSPRGGPETESPEVDDPVRVAEWQTR